MDKTVKKEIPNNVLLPQVGRLLEEGMEVTMSVKGFSMLPFIVGGRDSVVLKKYSVSPERLDIVLALTTAGNYVVHRVVKVEGDMLTLMGDGNLKGTERCAVANVLGKVVAVEYAGRKYNPYSPTMLCLSKVWIFLKPFRRYILAVWRHLFL